MTAGCKFCQIIAGDIPAHFVLDTDDVVAFLDHRPLFPGHTLVLPRDHVETLADLPEKLAFDLQDILAVARSPKAGGVLE